MGASKCISYKGIRGTYMVFGLYGNKIYSRIMARRYLVRICLQHCNLFMIITLAYTLNAYTATTQFEVILCKETMAGEEMSEFCDI